MWANFRLPVWLLISCLKLLRHSLYKISPFYCWRMCARCFNFFLYFFFGLIAKQIFEEKGKFIFIFLQIP